MYESPVKCTESIALGKTVNIEKDREGGYRVSKMTLQI